MVAFPVNPRGVNMAAQVPQGAIEVWRWDPTRGTPDYVQGSETGTVPAQMRLEPGRSFFLKNTTGGAVNLAVAGDVVDGTLQFALQVEQGWSMAGNMFAGALPWSNLGITPGEPVRDYGYIFDPVSQTYQLVTGTQAGRDLTDVIGATHTIPVNAGFWMRSDLRRTVTVKAVGTADLAAERPALELAASDYLIPIVARAAGRVDKLSVAGVMGQAGTLYRMENPPAVSPYVDVYFADGNGGRLAWDVRASAATKASWDFVVATDMADVTVDLSLPDLSRVPNDMTVTLVDQASGKRMYARTMTSYAYKVAEPGERRFTLEIAPRTEAGLVVTAAAQPAGQSVVMTYTLTKPAQTTVTITNIAGREIRTLGSGGVAPQGVNTLTWNLRNAEGLRVPAGRYVVKVSAVAEDGQAAQALATVQVRR